MEIFPIQHLTYKIWSLRLCNLIFAYCNVRSWHIQNCLTTLPLRSGCFPQQPAAKSHPLSFVWEIHPFLPAVSPPSLHHKSTFLIPEPQTSPTTLKMGNTKASPRWMMTASHLLACGCWVSAVSAAAELGLLGCCQPCSRALQRSHVQFSNCELVNQARQSLESQYHPTSCYPKLYL